MNKIPLFLISGLCAPPQIWEPLVQRSGMSSQFEIHHLEYPLHLEKVDFATLALFFKSAIEQYNTDRGILCGHSLGAHLCIRLSLFFPNLDLVLIQCSPAQSLSDLFSYFRPSPAMQYLYQENWNIVEQEIIESHLFNSFVTGKFQLLNQSWSSLRRELAIDLNQSPFPNEIEILNKLQSSATLIINHHDALLNTEMIKNKMLTLVPNLKMIETQGRDHYAFFDLIEDWFSPEIEKCFHLNEMKGS